MTFNIHTPIRRAIMPLLAILFFTASMAQAQSTEVNLIRDIAFLAHDELEGRMVGTVGERIASDFIIKRFQEMGAQPAGENGQFRQYFTAQPRVHGKRFGAPVTGHNVIASIAGTNPQAGWIVIGAHYDHWGWGGEGSLFRSKIKVVHNGADDNASGVASMLELARRIAAQPLEHTVVFIAFSGEERGLWGSNDYANNVMGDDHPDFMINMDMVGRLNAERQLAIYGTGTSPIWDNLLDNHNQTAGFKIKKEPSGVGPSDHTSFYLQDIPVLHFFTGQHEDYHRPSDDYEKINFAGLAELTDYIEAIVREGDALDEIPFTKTKNEQENTPRFKVTLGVVPDYLFDGTGMRIDGVTEGKPAANAKLQKGDIVLQLGKIEIKDMMDYMKALGEFEPGDITQTIILRNGEKIEVEIRFL